MIQVKAEKSTGGCQKYAKSGTPKYGSRRKIVYLQQDKRRNGTVKSSETLVKLKQSCMFGLDGNEDDLSEDDSSKALDALIEELEGEEEDEITPFSLKHLHTLINEHKLPFRIGNEETPGDGNCFLASILQNLIYLKDIGVWKKPIPADVDVLRASIIEFMKTNREHWTRPRYDSKTKTYSDGPFSQTFETADIQFDQLIGGQEKEDAWTDQEGFMVEATALYLDCQIYILQTGIEGPVTSEGLSGPLQIINKSEEETKPKLNVGLIKDAEGYNGHYQFIFEHPDGSDPEFFAPKKKFPVPKRNVSFASQVSNCFCNTTSHSCELCKGRVCIPCSKTYSKDDDDNKRYHLNCLKYLVGKGRPRSRQSPFNNYVKSPSARKHYLKTSNCHFCNIDAEYEHLEQHLHESNQCQILYYHKLRVKSVEEVVFKIYNCIFCNLGDKKKLKQHIQKTDNCFRKYADRFQESDLEEISKKISKIKRSFQQSRQSLIRKLNESEKQKLSRKKDFEQKTMESSLNDYRSCIQFGNYRLCFKCLTNSTDSMSEEVKIGSDIYEREDLGDISKQKLLRFEKFWICSACKTEEGRIIHESRIDMKHLNVHGRTVFIPDNNSNESVDEVLNRKTIFFPRTIEALKDITKSETLKKAEALITKINQTKPIDIEDVKLLYENEVSKYKARRDLCKRVKGKCISNDVKKLQIIKKCDEIFTVTGSSNWYQNQLSNMVCRMEQNGSICYHVEISFPIICLETIATALLQDGYVVTITKHGKPTTELITQYWVHTEHNNETPCQDECPRIDLHEYIENGYFDMDTLHDQHLTTHLGCTSKKFHQFIKHIIQATNSEILAEKYHFSLSFDLDGQAKMIGAIWPVGVDELNLHIASDSKCDSECTQSLIDFIDKTVTCSSDPEVLRVLFNLSDSDSLEMSELSIAHQFHMCENCTSCQNPNLPSLQTFVKKNVNHGENNDTAQTLMNKMRELLLEMSTEEKMSMTTNEWIESVWIDEDSFGDILEDELQITIDGTLFKFFIDDTLLSLISELGPFSGAYHYSLLCSKNNDEKIVLTRNRIRDCYTKPYNPYFLKAANAPVFVMPTKGNTSLAHFLTQKKNESLPDFLREEVSLLVFSHIEISMSEAVALLDPKIKFIKSSCPIEFVNAIKPEKRTMTFMKTPARSTDTFEDATSNDLYDICFSNIMRYSMRIGLIKLILSQFCVWYEFPGREESQVLHEKHIEKEIEIPSSDVELVSLENKKEYLPELIFLENGNVMKKRKNPRTLVYPKFKEETTDHMYSKLLMYTPFKQETEIIGPTTTLLERFNEKIEGESLRWESLEKKLFPLFKHLID